tara:strand:- start:1139 stop:1774 length:636 start_codon:yes stop_codon:yes gene_type:complete
MRVLFLTDSLSLPREGDGEVVKYDETYINILRKEFPEAVIADCAIGGATIWDLFKQSFYYKFFEPDLVVLHCGIVDCAPRAFTAFEQKVLNKLGLRPKGFTRFLRKNRGLKLTSKSQFEKLTLRLKNQFKDVPMYSIGILPASTDYEKKVPGIAGSVKRYNQILSKQFHFIDNSDFPREGILSDHHHLNKLGHKAIAKKLKPVFEKEIYSP